MVMVLLACLWITPKKGTLHQTPIRPIYSFSKRHHFALAKAHFALERSWPRAGLIPRTPHLVLQLVLFQLVRLVRLVRLVLAKRFGPPLADKALEMRRRFRGMDEELVEASEVRLRLCVSRSTSHKCLTGMYHLKGLPRLFFKPGNSRRK